MERIENKDKIHRKILEYEWIRFIAMIAVVIGHSCYMEIGYTKYSIPNDVSSAINWYIFSSQRWLSGFVYSFHMPLFFILSGAVFCHTITEKPIQSFGIFVKKKAKRLILPYICYGVLFMIPIKYIFGWYNPNTTYFKIVVDYLQFGSASGHLWFLSSLFFTFILAWIMVSCISFESHTDLFILLIISWLCCIWGKETGIKYPHHDEFQKIFSLYYLFCFFIGFYFERYRIYLNSIVDKS